MSLKAADIARMLGDRVDDLVRTLLPAARQDGHEWRIGSCAGEAGTSMGIHRSGARRGVWCDFSNDTMRGDALDLVAQVRFGGDKKQAFSWAKSWLGLDGLDPNRLQAVQREIRKTAAQEKRRAEKEAEQRARRAKAIWLNASKELAGSPVDLYLMGRGISIADMPRPPGSLRYAPKLDYLPDDDGVIEAYPAMLGTIVKWDRKSDMAGTIGLHRTYLHSPHPGVYKKAPVKNPKLVLGGMSGGFIPLARGASGKKLTESPSGDHILISEGIEDGLSASMCLPDYRVIAGISVNNFASIELPHSIERVTILRQNKDKPGSDADRMIEKAMDKFEAEGREVFEYRPPAEYDDLNHFLQSRMEARG